MPDGTKVATIQGTPQGGPLSPLLSNIVLDEWDRELGRRGLRFVRYADDCNIFVRSRRGWAEGDGIDSAIFGDEVTASDQRGEKLRHHTGKGPLPGFSFLSSKATIGLRSCCRPRPKRNCLPRSRSLTPRSWGQSLRNCFEKINEYFRGWVGHFRICTEEGASEFRRYDAHLQRRLRAIIIHQKKRARFSVPSSPATGG